MRSLAAAQFEASGLEHEAAYCTYAATSGAAHTDAMNRLQGDVKIAEEAGNVATKTNAVLGQALQGDRARLERARIAAVHAQEARDEETRRAHARVNSLALGHAEADAVAAQMAQQKTPMPPLPPPPQEPVVSGPGFAPAGLLSKLQGS